VNEHGTIMPGVRRSAIAIEAERRNREQRARVGAEITAMRNRRGWTRTELARRAGLGRMVESRLERGIGPCDLDALQRIAVALDQPVQVTFGRDRLEAPADAGHLAILELVLGLGRAAGYAASFELPTRPAEPWRSADVGLRNETARRLVLVECWNTIGDVGAAARSSERKRAEAEALAAGRWGEEPAIVGLVWVVRATARNRALVARYPEVFAARFPGSSGSWGQALTLGMVPPAQPGLVWCDVAATRLFAWRRPPR
jgi:transcriptional regulator with XRE-family HTH domain